MERFVLGMDRMPFLHGAFSLRPWNGRPVNRLDLEMHRLDSRSDRLVFQIDRRLLPLDRHVSVMVHTRNAKPLKNEPFAGCVPAKSQRLETKKSIGAENALWAKKPCQEAEEMFNGLKRESATDALTNSHPIDMRTPIRCKLSSPSD